MNIKQTHPFTIEQDTNQSIVKNGYYDLTCLSEHEKQVVYTVLKNSHSGKYPKRLYGLGLANESYPIIYKPRYILFDIIIQLYKDSKNPYDLLAVAIAYETKGYYYCQQAIAYYEAFISKANFFQKKKAKECFFEINEPYFSNKMSKLYESVNAFDKALFYAIKSEKNNFENLPHYPKHVAQIYMKIDPLKSVIYLEKIFRSSRYKNHYSVLLPEYEKAKELVNKNYKYKPRASNRSKHSIEFEKSVSNAAREFLPGGKYYKKDILP